MQRRGLLEFERVPQRCLRSDHVGLKAHGPIRTLAKQLDDNKRTSVALSYRSRHFATTTFVARPTAPARLGGVIVRYESVPAGSACPKAISYSDRPFPEAHGYVKRAPLRCLCL